MNYKAADAKYLALINKAVAICANYRPQFGQGRKAGLALADFQKLYGADPFYSWLGLDSPLMYAAHKANGGMTSFRLRVRGIRRRELICGAVERMAKRSKPTKADRARERETARATPAPTLPVREFLKNEERGTFADYWSDAHNWITLATGEFYPDILVDACQLYEPVLVTFGQLVRSSESSTRLFLATTEIRNPWMRVQLARVFRKYASPDTPVEMLKKKSSAPTIVAHYGKRFRKIAEVQAAFSQRPMPDEALCAVLWEYKDRGKKGYDLTERLFELIRAHLPDLTVRGPERAGKDVPMGAVFENYPKPARPVDFVVTDGSRVLAIGLARYDSDRGGAQEDDRTGGYRDCASEILTYSRKHGLDVKVIFLNDGPGLLLGSMWSDYAALENAWPGKVKVVTLRMIPERITADWLQS